jgi:hypothetical protein
MLDGKWTAGFNLFQSYTNLDKRKKKQEEEPISAI